MVTVTDSETFTPVLLVTVSVYVVVAVGLMVVTLRKMTLVTVVLFPKLFFPKLVTLPVPLVKFRKREVVCPLLMIEGAALKLLMAGFGTTLPPPLPQAAINAGHIQIIANRMNILACRMSPSFMSARASFNQ